MNTTKENAVELKKAITVCLKVGSMLLEHGAETAIISNMVERTGALLGMDHTEISLSASSMVISLSKNDAWYTRAAKCPERGVNMNVTMTVQQIVIKCEREHITLDEMLEKLDSIPMTRHNRWFTALIVALSCGCFSKLAGANLSVFSVVTLASFTGVVVLQTLKHNSFNHLVACTVSAFTTTLITGFAAKAGFVDEKFSAILLFSAVLMLVPGVPLVNSVSDILKNYKNMGLARGTSATLLTLAIVIGMIVSMNILGL